VATSNDSTKEHPTLREKPVSNARAVESPRSNDETLPDVLHIGDWRLKRLSTLAGGGFGAIEVAVDSVLQRRLAMKVIHKELQQDELTLQLFVREALITAQLDHPNIVPIHDVGRDANDRPYLTMKLVEGNTLAQIVNAQERPLRWDALRDRIEIVIKLCDALSFAHSRGVVHCDVKSDNVMVGDFGQVYLMDWGAAKLLKRSEISIEGPLREAVGLAHLQLPAAHCVLGTPGYMPPEQASGDRASLDERADIFSLGAVLYHVVTGEPPYPSGATGESLESARKAQIPPLSQVSKDPVPRDFERIVMKALAPDRNDRYRSVDVLRSDLAAFIRGHSGFPQASYADGDLIIREGDPGDAAYILVSGQCEVFETIEGKRRTLRKMGPGEVFGEAAVLSPGPRTASVMACEPTELLVIDREELRDEVGALKPWLARVLRTLAARFRDSESARVFAESEHDASDSDE